MINTASALERLRALRTRVQAVLARFQALDVFHRTLVVVGIVVVGAGLAAGAVLLVKDRSPDALRDEVRKRLAEQDYLGARRALAALEAGSTAGLSDTDRWELAAPVEKAVSDLETSYREEVAEHRRAGRFDAALASLRTMKTLGLALDWVAYMQAEVLRADGRSVEAVDAYVRCADLYPTSPLADDALYWASVLAIAIDQPKRATSLLQRLIASYPSSTWRGAADRAVELVH